MKTRVVLIFLLCMLFVGFSPPQEKEWSVVLTNRTEYSKVTFERFEGDTLVAVVNNTTIFIPLSNVSLISSRSVVLGLSGCWFGFGTGAIAGAACGAAVGKAEGPSGREISTGATMGFGSMIGAMIGAPAGCVIFPEDEKRYDIGNMPLDVKRGAINAIVDEHSAQRKQARSRRPT